MEIVSKEYVFVHSLNFFRTSPIDGVGESDFFSAFSHETDFCARFLKKAIGGTLRLNNLIASLFVEKIGEFCVNISC